MARKRPTASNVRQARLTTFGGARPDSDGPLLTRAEANALRRSAPLTHLKLQQYFNAVRAP